MRYSHILSILLLFAMLSKSQNEQRVITPQLKGSLKFTENLGQWEDEVLFKASFSNGALFMEKDGVVLNFLSPNQIQNFHGKTKQETTITSKSKVFGHAIKLKFLNSLDPLIEKYQQGEDYENYFIGNDKSKWKSNVKNYKQILYKSIYNKIDYEILADGRGVKYNWRIRPGGIASDVKIEYIGTENIKINKEGFLIIKLAFKEIWEQKPYAYQLIKGKVVEVKCNFKLDNNVVTYELPNGYDKNYELIIDPIVVFSSSLGSTNDNFGMTATYDFAGHLYSGGMIYGINLPGSLGAYDQTFNNPIGDARTDVFISKYLPNGMGLIYSTYLGGNESEAVSSLIVDYSGNLCLYGATASGNFPTTSSAFDVTFNGGSLVGFYGNGIVFCGGSDIFISKFNNNGTSLLASTYYGGNGNDGVNYLTNLFSNTPPYTNPCATTFPDTPYDSLVMNYGDQFRGEIQVDKQNNIYIVSSTRSSNIPTINGFDNTLNGGQDAIFAKFNNGLSNLLSASFMGGSQNDCGNSLSIDNSNNIFVTGGTCSSNLLGTTTGHAPLYLGGKTDGFIYKISPTGASILNASYIGTSNYDNSFFVTTDKKNRVYVFGQSHGNMSVVQASTAATIYSVANTHQFIRAYNNNLTNIYFSTVVGSKTITSVDISPSAFAVDVCGNIYLSGWGGGLVNNTVSISGMPTYSAIPGFTLPPNGYDFYFMALDSNAVNLKFGSYFGGNLSKEHVDGGTSRFDPNGRIYQSICAGCWSNDDFPIIPSNAYPCGTPSLCPANVNPSPLCNNGVIKLDFQFKVAVATINTNTFSGCVPLTVSFTNATAPTSTNATFIWYNGLGGTNTTNINPTTTYTAPGVYTVALVVIDPTSCNTKDSTSTIITVFPRPNPAFTASFSPCTPTLQLNNTSTGSLTPSSYTWNVGPFTSTLTNPGYSLLADGTYSIQLNVTDINGCSNSTNSVITVFNFTPGVNSATLCQGQTVNLSAVGGTSYTWQPSSAVSNTALATTATNPTNSTIYTVTIFNTALGNNCIRTLTTSAVVNFSPTASFTHSQNPCGGGVYFTSTSSTNSAAYNWTISPVFTSTLQNPYFFYFNGGPQNVSLVVTTTAGCTHSVTEVINVAVPPPVGINVSNKICVGELANLTASGGVSYSWTPSQTLAFPNSANTTASPTVTTTYSVIITTTNGCQLVLFSTVGVDYPSAIPVNANANPQKIILGDNSTLVYVGDPGATVTWFPAGSTIPATGYTVTATPSLATTYTAIAQYGVCRNIATTRVEVVSNSCIDKDTFVPNTFTPNSDGENDVLYVRSAFIEQIYFAVYNRWGELVFETTDKSKGWDGLYKGRPADVGVFGWYLKVKCPNGEENFKKGNVTLIR